MSYTCSPIRRPETGNWTFAILLVLLVYCLMVPGDAWATNKTLGNVIQQGAQNYRTLPRYLNYISYVAGLIVSILGIQKLRQHVDRPDQVPFSHGTWHLAGGVFLISLPAAWNILARSFALFTPSGATQSAVGAVSLSVAAATPLSLDVMMIRFINDVRGPMQYVIWTLAAVLGLFFLITAFLRMARGAAVDGPRGSLGSGTLMRILIGSILLSFAATSDAITSTFFGGGGVVRFDGMSIPGVAASDLTRANQAMAAVLVLIQIIGFLAFLRGFLMLRALADGNSSVSSAAAFTHIIGGSLAFNISPMLAALQKTFCPTGSGCDFINFS